MDSTTEDLKAASTAEVSKVVDLHSTEVLAGALHSILAVDSIYCKHLYDYVVNSRSSSIVNLGKLFLSLCELLQKIVLKEVLITSLSSENIPFLQTIFGVLSIISSHLDHLIFGKLFGLLEFFEGCFIGFLSSLCVQHMTVPLSDFGQYIVIVELINIQTIVTECHILIEPFFKPKCSQVIVHAHFRNDLMVKLSPDPYKKFSSTREDAESFANISN